MQSNFAEILELILFVIIAIIVALVIIGFVSWVILRLLKIDVKKVFKITKGTIFTSMITIIIAALSWLFNFGWLRFIATIMLIPFIHAVVFFITNFFMVAYSAKIDGIKRLNLFFIITYLLGYLLLPDGGDVGGMYFFFGLIHNDALASFAYQLSAFFFFAHIVLFVLQIAKVFKFKKANKEVSTENKQEDNGSL